MPEIVYVILTCVFIAWTLATGPVDTYETYMSNELESVSTELTSIICFDDDELHDVVIYAVDEAGAHSPPSEPLWIQRIFNCDSLGTGAVAIPDIFALIPRIGVDLNIFDLFVCIDRIGCTNDGVVEECP